MHFEPIRIESPSPEGTYDLGRAIGQKCRGGEILLLSADLGAGKTCFAQGLARGLEVEAPVTSPSYTLHCEYAGRLIFHHIDLYRLGDNLDWEHLGFDELLGTPGTVTAVEWAAFLGEAIPRRHLDVRISTAGPTSRIFRLTATDAMHEDIVSGLP